MFLKKNWYVAAWSHEIESRTLLARRLLGIPVLLLRGEDGRVTALHDQCCHRALPLSMGMHEGDGVRCGYHGMKYDCSGACVEIPGQPHIPSQARVQAWPVVEQDGLLWIWMGESAPVGSPPEYGWHGRWHWRGGLFHYAANHELINDNLLDLSHLGYVHKNTIGGDPKSHMTAEMTTARQDDGVLVQRYMRSVTPPPTHVRINGYTDTVDRWQRIQFHPGLITIYSGSVPDGTVRTEGEQVGGFQQRVFNAVTPETEHTSFYFFSISHPSVENADEVTDRLYADTVATFEEDKIVIESQYARMQENRGQRLIDLKIDAGALQARRIIRLKLQQDSPPPPR